MNALDLFAVATAHPAVISVSASALAGILTLIALLAGGGSGRGPSSLIGTFAAASLLAATLLHLLPEALHLSATAGGFALLGFALVYAIAALTSPNGAPRPALAAAIAPMLGIGAHSFLDGALHATVFAVDLDTGLIAAPGLVLHEVAETALLFVLLLRAGLARLTAAGLAFVGAVATTPLGALAFQGPIAGLNDAHLGWALGAVAGSLVYLSVSHLAEGSVRRWPQFAAFAGGVALTFALMAASTPHDADHKHGADDAHHAGHDHAGRPHP